MTRRMSTERIDIEISTAVINRAYLPLMVAVTGAAAGAELSDAARRWHKRYLLMFGGRGSGKSRAAAQAVVLLMLTGRYRVALVRKVADTIRDSQWQEIRDVVEAWGLQRYFRTTVSPLKIHCTRTGSTAVSKGFDRSEKIKSLASIDFVWIEEVTELTLDDWRQLNFTIRGRNPAGRNRQILMTFNPINPEHWVKKAFFAEGGSLERAADDESTTILHTTCRDNRFLDRVFLTELDKLRDTDPDLYTIITLGRWTKLKGLIFPAYKTVETYPALPSHYYGLDFGFSETSPAALVKVGARVEGRKKSLYIDEALYMPGLSPSELIEQLDERIPPADKHVAIYCDDARPETIKEMRRAGYNAIAWKKGASSVYEGIMLLKMFELNVTETSVNIVRELNLYKWKEDRSGNQLPEPVKKHDHSPDAIRGVVYTALASLVREPDDNPGAVCASRQSVAVA